MVFAGGHVLKYNGLHSIFFKMPVSHFEDVCPMSQNDEACEPQSEQDTACSSAGKQSPDGIPGLVWSLENPRLALRHRGRAFAPCIIPGARLQSGDYTRLSLVFLFIYVIINTIDITKRKYLGE